MPPPPQVAPHLHNFSVSSTPLLGATLRGRVEEFAGWAMERSGVLREEDSVLFPGPGVLWPSEEGEGMTTWLLAIQEKVLGMEAMMAEVRASLTEEAALAWIQDHQDIDLNALLESVYGIYLHFYRSSSTTSSSFSSSFASSFSPSSSSS